MAASAAESNKATGEAINIGSYQEISMKDWETRIADIMRAEREIMEEDQKRIRPRRSHVVRSWTDNKKASTLLEWVSEGMFDAGLKETVAHFRRPENLEIYGSTTNES